MAHTFNAMYDLIQGTTKADIFNQNPDTTPKTKADAIKEVLKLDYQPAKNQENGRKGSDALDSDTEKSEGRRPGIQKDDRGPEQDPNGTKPTNDRARAGTDGAKDGPAVEPGSEGEPGEAGEDGEVPLMYGRVQYNERHTLRM